MRIAPRLAPSPATSSRKRSVSSAQSTSFRSCVIVFGAFTENLNVGGTDAAHLSYVVARCGRWNDELISTARNTDEYFSSCVPCSGRSGTVARDTLHPAHPM